VISAARGVFGLMATVGWYPDSQIGRVVEIPVSPVMVVKMFAVMVVARAVAPPEVTDAVDPVGPSGADFPVAPVGPVEPV